MPQRSSRVDDSRPPASSPHGPARRWPTAEFAAWTLGIVCLAVWAAVSADGAIGGRAELKRFAAMQAAAPRPVPPGAAEPDLSLWEPKRIAAWRDALRTPGAPPLGVVRIPKVHIEAPLLPGTDDVTLNRGVGHIEGTALPGTDGNAGIAGHRDGFFRGLKDVGPGDTIELETLQGREVYRVERIWIVVPEDVSVLDATTTRALTLVTCYPFYFVGPAPQRLIVRAVRDDSASPEGR